MATQYQYSQELLAANKVLLRLQREHQKRKQLERLRANTHRRPLAAAGPVLSQRHTGPEYGRKLRVQL